MLGVLLDITGFVLLDTVISPRLTVIDRLQKYLYSFIVLNADELIKWEAASKKDAENVEKISNLEHCQTNII